MPQVYINWVLNGTLIEGFNPNNNNKINTGLTFPVSFPGVTTSAQTITMTSSSRNLGTYETFNNVRFYLDGDSDQLAIIQEVWPYYGANPSNPNGVHPSPELDGGFQISFDSGQTFIRFDREHGYKADPTTWITLPETALGTGGVAGVLGAFDIAQMTVQYCIPPQADQLQIISVNLMVDFDVV